MGSGGRYPVGGQIMRNRLMVLWVLMFLGAPVLAEVSVGISLSLYPELVPIAGYPVYYAPRLDSNYFFYDGMYWVYQGDNWYASSWYNGPWALVAPEAVPLYILRVPVRYYRHPPSYFQGWQSNSPPHWDEHWGSGWAQRRHGWDQWNHNSAPAPAPLPAYQQNYAGDRYPEAAQQQALQNKNYRYQPRDPEVRQHYQAPAVQSAPAPARREAQVAPPQERTTTPSPPAVQRPNPPPQVQQSAPPAGHAQPPQRDHERVSRPAPTPAPPQQGGPAVQEQRQQPQQGAQHLQQAPMSPGREGPQGKQAPQDSERGQGAGQGGDHEKAGAGVQEQGGAGQEHKR
jgi:hypothetical protein